MARGGIAKPRNERQHHWVGLSAALTSSQQSAASVWTATVYDRSCTEEECGQRPVRQMNGVLLTGRVIGAPVSKRPSESGKNFCSAEGLRPCAKNGPEQVQQGGSGKVESLRSECAMAPPPFTPTSAPSSMPASRPAGLADGPTETAIPGHYAESSAPRVGE
jgi:hypothetical protein